MLLQKVEYTSVKDGRVQSINTQAQVPKDLLTDMEVESGATDTFMGFYNRTVKKFADQAYRTILVTYKEMSMREFN